MLVIIHLKKIKAYLVFANPIPCNISQVKRNYEGGSLDLSICVLTYLPLRYAVLPRKFTVFHGGKGPTPNWPLPLTKLTGGGGGDGEGALNSRSDRDDWTVSQNKESFCEGFVYKIGVAQWDDQKYGLSTDKYDKLWLIIHAKYNLGTFLTKIIKNNQIFIIFFINDRGSFGKTQSKLFVNYSKGDHRMTAK